MTPLKFFSRHWHDVGLASAVIAGIYLIEQVWLGSRDPNYHPFDEDELARFHIVEKFEAAEQYRAQEKAAKAA